MTPVDRCDEIIDLIDRGPARGDRRVPDRADVGRERSDPADLDLRTNAGESRTEAV